MCTYKYKYKNISITIYFSILLNMRIRLSSKLLHAAHWLKLFWSQINQKGIESQRVDWMWNQELELSRNVYRYERAFT